MNTSNTKNKEGVLKKIGIPLALIVLFGLMFMPTPEGLTIEGQKAIAIFCSALVLWVCGSLPILSHFVNSHHFITFNTYRSERKSSFCYS